MTCQECIDFLLAYLDGELPADERAHFEQHLQLCPPCVEYLNGYRAAVRLCHETAAEERKQPCQPMPEALVQAILAARRKPAE